MEIAVMEIFGELRDRRAARHFSISFKAMVVIYSNALRGHLEEILKERLDPEVLKGAPIEYVITAPSAWVDHILGPEFQIRQCAESAGTG
jgi:hypothetical protein